MKLELTAMERMAIPLFFRDGLEKGSYTDMLVADEIRDMTKIKSEELEGAKTKDLGNGDAEYDANKVEIKEFDFNEVQESLMNKVFKELDSKGNITKETLPLCKKIK
jgi:hypothetical protein